MAEEQDGVTATLNQTVEPQSDLDQVGLADILKDTLERDEQPEPQPADAEEQSEESESPDEAPVSAGGDEGNDLSQTETTDAEAEPAADEVEDDEQPEGLPPDIQEKVNKRIGKEVRKRKTVEEEKAAEISELKAQLAEAQAEGAENTEFAPAPTEVNPFANLNSVEDVQKEMLRAEQTLEWAEDNPEGALLETKEGEQEFTQDDVREIRKKAARAMRRQLPEQLGFIQARDHLEPQALEAFPWWKDKASSEFQNAMQVLRQMPDLARFPDYKFVVGDYLAGRTVRENSLKAKAPAKGVKKAPSQPTAPTAEPAPIDQSTVRSASAHKAFQESGGVDELANIIKLGL
jgi:hypothetical protein